LKHLPGYMQGLSIDTLSHFLDRSIEEKVIKLTQKQILGLPESMLLQLLDTLTESDHNLILKQDIIEFLINVRRYHFSYYNSNELWGIMEQYLNKDLQLSNFESGPYGMFIDIDGLQDSGYSIIPITNHNLTDLKPFLIPLFDGFISTMPKRYMRVVFFDSTKSMRNNFPFQFNINCKFLTIEETNEVELFSGFLPSYLNSLKESKPNEELIELRKMAITFIRNVEPELFRLSFELITEQLEGDFQYDMFHFLNNSLMIREHLKSQKDLIKSQVPESHYATFTEVDFSNVDYSNPNPDIVSFTKEMMDESLSKFTEEEKSHPKYKFLEDNFGNTNRNQIILLCYNRNKSEIHGFEFDITMVIE